MGGSAGFRGTCKKRKYRDRGNIVKRMIGIALAQIGFLIGILVKLP